MEGFDYVAAVAVVISFVSLMVVVFQLHDLMEQRKLESLTRLYDINRELIILGFRQPELFKILHDQQGADSSEIDPMVERHYLQLWLNQVVLIFYIQRRGLFAPDLRASWEADARDLLQQENLKRHWRRCRQFYPVSFQNYVDSLTDPEVKRGMSFPDS